MKIHKELRTIAEEYFEYYDIDDFNFRYYYKVLGYCKANRGFIKSYDTCINHRCPIAIYEIYIDGCEECMRDIIKPFIEYIFRENKMRYCIRCIFESRKIGLSHYLEGRIDIDIKQKNKFDYVKEDIVKIAFHPSRVKKYIEYYNGYVELALDNL